MRLLAILLILAIWAAAPAVAQEYPPGDPGSLRGPRGYTGPAGSPGPQGVPGPPGRPPTKQEIQEALVAYLDADNSAPAPAWAKPALEEAVRQGLVVGYPDGTYRWLRPATRAEVGIVVGRAWDKIQVRLNGHEVRIFNLESENIRQDRQIGGLYGETRELRQADETLRGVVDWRSAALAFFASAIGLAAAAFGLLAAMAAARR